MWVWTSSPPQPTLGPGLGSPLLHCPVYHWCSCPDYQVFILNSCWLTLPYSVRIHCGPVLVYINIMQGAVTHLTAGKRFDNIDWKKKHNIKVENLVLFYKISEDFKPRSSLSDSSKGFLWRHKWGARIYRRFPIKIRQLEHRKITFN